jgi:hypothetical protein
VIGAAGGRVTNQITPSTMIPTIQKKKTSATATDGAIGDGPSAKGRNRRPAATHPIQDAVQITRNHVGIRQRFIPTSPALA